MSDPVLLEQIMVAAGMGLLGAVVFAAIGLVSGTDETTTLAPLTLLVVLLGVPPAGVFTFFLAGAVAKHMTHAVPTALLGIPGDTLATPLLQDANMLRKMVSGAIVAAFVAVPLAVLFAVLLAPFGGAITKSAPWIFLAAAVLIAYFSAGRWAAVALLVPFVVVIVALQSLTAKYGVKLSISYFLGIAIGPLIADLFTVIAPQGRAKMMRDKVRTFSLAPDVKGWSGYFPNPLKVMDRIQTRWTLATATISSATFVFSPVAMTVVLGELVGSRVKHAYHRLTTVLSARNGVTEATYIAEALIPLIAFGLPLSPVAAGPAAPLFNAPPRFTVDAASGQTHNLHNLLNHWEFLGYGMLAVLLAAIVSYPFAMNFARRAALFVSRKVSHEAIIATFVGLIIVISVWEGQFLGLLVILTMGLFGGLLSRLFGFNTGVQFMGYYTAVLTVPALVKLVA
ncbi:tripartite tricarboxylate transporter permease [Achromobacter xylosoxidans]|uniref:tripartite tricarboxylate transporter permease n=1 Tax=Alcaligenes xylosoxydans xylosoxydans TaxID=85698 RepID=UPI002ACAA502|nr:tripartite tricarboxylate transporter permease [Achromobacter xylosoxidans]MDZ5613783.1 tripartite tricarboxylate transporter permease [Achromobacter xylosoxidans]MDZ5628888.1 tripartite tricarboxylate transporter permease [Achromobacter xylosoxidans]MDZ5688855.1 tripartite tricarboxylate transporter permease [Achromobacter xylosoxidans]